MQFNIKYLGFLIGFICMISSCKNAVTDAMVNKPTAMGRINNVVILTDKEMAESAIGDTVINYFQSAYPVLPAEEPMFDLRFLTPEDLIAKPLQKELRIYVLVADVADTLSSTTKMLRTDLGAERFSRAIKDTTFTSSIGNNKWAKEQIVFYIFANGKEKLTRAIRDNFPLVAKRINQHDEKNLQATVFGIKGENRTLSAEILDSFGISIRIPDLYVKALQDKNFMWLRMDNKEIIQSLVFRKFPYRDQSQFSLDSIISMRNTYGKQFIRTGFADAYMSTNVIDLPALEYSYTSNNVFVKEVRGIWETENDFMGGPFVSYVLHNEAAGEIVFIDAFVFAPGKEKRDFVQQLDCIVKTASFAGVIKN